MVKMKRKIAQFLILLVAIPAYAGTGQSAKNNYAIGAIIAFLILGYLVYSLVKPEKF